MTQTGFEVNYYIMVRFIRLTVFAMTLLASAGTLLAQEVRGTILGRVTDSSGAVVPGITVRVVNAASNVSFSTRSNAEGNYEIPYLVPGTYKLSAAASGFKTVVRDSIDVRISERVSINVAMEVGQVTEQITVTTEVPLLETATASMGQVIDQRRISDLPMAHGNPYLLMALSGGVVFTQAPGLDQPYAPTHIVGYSMDGVRTNRSEITMDGSTNVGVIGRYGADLMAGYTPPADVVREMKVETSPFDASVGHTQGGVTAVTLKTGGNKLHGTAYYWLLDPTLTANTFFANKAGQPIADYNYKRWGGSATGPVYLPKIYNGRDRTFFTYGFEGIHDSRPYGATYGEGTLTVPTVAEKRGDFSALLALGSQYQIYDPASRIAAPNGRTMVQPLAGNIIPANRISPIATKIISYWPDPTNPGTRCVNRKWREMEYL